MLSKQRTTKALICAFVVRIWWQKQVFSCRGFLENEVHDSYKLRKSLGFCFKIYRKWAATWQNQQSYCAPSEDWDQRGHPPSLIRVFACAQWVAKDPSFLHADSEDSDQSGQMPRLIWVFAGRTAILFVMSLLKSLKAFLKGLLNQRKLWKQLRKENIYNLSSNQPCFC